MLFISAEKFIKLNHLKIQKRTKSILKLLNNMYNIIAFNIILTRVLFSDEATHSVEIGEVENYRDYTCYVTLQATPSSIRCHVFRSKTLVICNFLELGSSQTVSPQEKKETKNVFPSKKEVRVHLSFSDTESGEEN